MAEPPHAPSDPGRSAADRDTTLIVDLRAARIDSWDALWDSLGAACALPAWFGRNLDAWWDAIETGGVSEIVDRHRRVVIHVPARGLFAADGDGARFVATTDESARVSVEVDGGAVDGGAVDGGAVDGGEVDGAVDRDADGWFEP